MGLGCAHQIYSSCMVISRRGREEVQRLEGFLSLRGVFGAKGALAIFGDGVGQSNELQI